MVDDLNTLAATINTALSGEEVDFRPIFATTVDDALTALGVDTTITYDEILNYLNGQADFDITTITKQDVLDFFATLQIDVTTIDQGMLIEELRTMGIKLIPKAETIASVLQNDLNITIKPAAI